jgi:diaminopimelate decarboxylase
MLEWEIPGYLELKNDKVTLDGVDISELAAEYGTPLYVFSEKRLHANVQEILSGFRQVFPKTSLHYAAKCESTLAHLEVIREAGSDLEVNSGGELFKGLQAGFSGSQIVFNGVAKTITEIKSAISNEIKAINVDSEFELDRIISSAREVKKIANICIRFVPEVSTGVVKGNETGTHESKFGITKDALLKTINVAMAASDAVNLRGLHFHIGTQTFDLHSFVAAFKVMLATAVEIHQTTGCQMQMLNIGGGLPVPHRIELAASQYMDSNIYQMLRGTLTTAEIAKAIAMEMQPEKVREWAGIAYAEHFANVELLVESGRKVVADAAVLISKIENKKERMLLGEPWLMIDAGFNTLNELKTYFWYYHMVSLSKAGLPHDKSFKVAGPCCDSGDVHFDIDFHKNLPDYRRLPGETDVGDLVVMLNTGAYGTPTMMNYNGRPKAGILLIRSDGKIGVTRRPETYHDLIATEPNLANL